MVREDRPPVHRGRRVDVYVVFWGAIPPRAAPPCATAAPRPRAGAWPPGPGAAAGVHVLTPRVRRPAPPRRRRQRRPGDRSGRRGLLPPLGPPQRGPRQDMGPQRRTAPRVPGQASLRQGAGPHRPRPAGRPRLPGVLPPVHVGRRSSRPPRPRGRRRAARPRRRRAVRRPARRVPRRGGPLGPRGGAPGPGGRPGAGDGRGAAHDRVVHRARPHQAGREGAPGLHEG